MHDLHSHYTKHFGGVSKKMRKLMAIAVLTVMIAITACTSGNNTNTNQGSGASSAPADGGKKQSEVVLKLGHGTSTDSLYHLGATKFKELVESKTNGAVKVEIHSDGSIGHDADLINLLKTGNVHAGMLGVEPLVSIASKLSVIGLPYIFPTRDAAYTVLDGELGQEMVAELPSAHGLRILSFFENGFRNVSNSKHAISSPDDMSGLKLRTPQSAVSLAIFEALGANPTPLSFGELYTALEQKTIDGQENPLALIYSNKFYEVQKHISLTGHMYSPMVLAISEKSWNQMTPETQQAVQEAANEARDYERSVSESQENDLINKLKEAGVTITEVDKAPFIEATKDVHLKFDGDYGADFYQKVVNATSGN